MTLTWDVGCPICGELISCSGKAWVRGPSSLMRIEPMDHGPVDEHMATAHPSTVIRWGNSPSYSTFTPTTTEKPWT